MSDTNYFIGLIPVDDIPMPYLCSNNINIHDLVFVPGKQLAGNIIDENDLIYWKSLNAYKVIGEVSFEDHLKDFQKIKEEDIQFIFILTNSEINEEFSTFVSEKLFSFIDENDIFEGFVVKKKSIMININ